MYGGNENVWYDAMVLYDSILVMLYHGTLLASAKPSCYCVLSWQEKLDWNRVGPKNDADANNKFEVYVGAD